MRYRCHAHDTLDIPARRRYRIDDVPRDGHNTREKIADAVRRVLGSPIALAF